MVWSNGATTQDINNLTFGSYFVTVTDANGCPMVSELYTITEPSDITITLQEDSDFKILNVMARMEGI